MKCPKCQSDMEKVVYQSIEIDRCTHCLGMWFDKMEAEKLKELKGSEQIDIGNPAEGKVFNKVDKIKCPRCKTEMGKVVDSDQPHIWYETCEVCCGSFFDAGEFKDYKEENFLDLFRDMFTRPRQ